MRKWQLVLMMCLALALVTHSARADKISETRRAIQSRYNALNAALMRRDLPAISAIHAADYQANVGERKNIDRAALLLSLRRSLKEMETIKGKTTVLQFSLNGTKATAWTRTRMDLEVRQPGHAPLQKLVVETSYKDIWIKRGRQWLRWRATLLKGKTLPNR